MQANRPPGAGASAAEQHDAELAGADTAQLEVWAFSRQNGDTDPELAAAALRELARRSGETSAEHDASAAPQSPRRPRLLRAAIIVTAGIVLAAIIAIALVVTALRPQNSLAVFDRPPSEVEVEMSDLMQQFVLGGDANARVL
ncbi:MAG: hypothetical protein Q7J04_01575, partial [Microcella sp.]|nr:hypothetical protein [Microcella sp.]